MLLATLAETYVEVLDELVQQSLGEILDVLADPNIRGEQAGPVIGLRIGM